eukprot:gene4665-5111_t
MREKEDSLWSTCLASGLAGAVGRFVCHPIDTLKAKLQVTDRKITLRKIVSRTWQEEGVAGFYRGVTAVLLGGVPGVCVYILTYESCKARLETFSHHQHSPFLSYLGSGMVAEAVCCAFFIPVDVVKERLQVQANRQAVTYRYRGSADALRTILQREGLRGLYKGYWATLFSYGPFSSIYFWLFEEMKSLRKRRQAEDLVFHDYLLSSAVAGSLASFLTNPLDIAKLRFQVQQTTIKAETSVVVREGEEVVYRGLLHALSHLYRSLGLRGLFRGASARVLFHTPSTAITMAIYEQTKAWLDVWKVS